MRRSIVAFALVALTFSTMAAAAEWRQLGPLGGRINAAVTDRQYAGRAYVATDRGVYVREANGATMKLHETPGYESEQLLVDPHDPRTMYVVDNALESFFVLINRPSHLFKTTDGGATWHELTNGLPPSASISSIALDPSGTTLYLGLQCGIQSFKGACETCAADAATREGVYKSTDAGESWSFASNGMSGAYLCIKGVAVDPLTPNVVYAYSETLTSDYVVGYWRSTDAGATWTRSATAQPTKDIVAVDSFRYGIQQRPNGAGQLVVSSDGVNWIVASVAANLAVNDVATDGTRLAIAAADGAYYVDTETDRLWALTPGSNAEAIDVTLSSGFLAGLKNGLLINGSIENIAPAATVIEIATDPHDARTVVAKLADYDVPQRFVVSHDGGVTWQETNGLPPLQEPGFPFGIHPKLSVDAAGTTYAIANNGTPSASSLQLFRLPAGSNSWLGTQTLANPQLVVADPLHGGVAWIVTGGGAIWKTIDGGARWEKVATVDGSPSTMAIDRRNDTLYIATTTSIFHSGDGGLTWQASQQPIGATSITVSPVDGRVYAYNCCNSLMRSGDGGRTWVAVTVPDAGLRGVLADARLGNVVYAWGVESGVYRSDDYGMTWSTLDSGLPTRRINWLATDAVGDTLYAGTFRHSIAALTLRERRRAVGH